MLFWLGKDFAWNTQNQVMWVACLIPTFLIALDFIWVTARTRRMAIDVTHYVAQAVWVVGGCLFTTVPAFSTFPTFPAFPAFPAFSTLPTLPTLP
jgi:hypothetical protein